MKIRVSIPDGVFLAAERTARRLGISRSQLYSKAIAAYVRPHSRDDTTERLDSIYAKRSPHLESALETLSLEVLRRERW